MDTDQNLQEECDCAPTAAERRVLWNPMSRRNAITVGALGIAAAGGAIAFGQTLSANALTYDPSDYPSWDDVQRAKNNEAAKAGQITSIEAMIADLQNRVAVTKQAAIEAGDAYYAAQQAFFQAAYRADELQKQADAQAETATAAATTAARLAAQLGRVGGEDTSLQLFFSDSSTNADQLLTRLGQMDKLMERNKSVYDDAVTQRDSAQALSDQAKDARAERDRLQKIAEQKLAEARAAQAAAEQALATQQANLITLQAQLAALKDTTSTTVAEYERGVAAKKAYEEEQRRLAAERARKAAEEAARRAAAQAAAAQKAAEEAAAAAKNNSGGGSPASTGGGGGGSAPAPVSNGWVRPNWGVQTSGYGWRSQICGSSYCSSSFHAGVDLAQGCGSAIYAAHSGTVVYAGYNGGYGNYIHIENNDGTGIGTGYAHIMNGGILVGYGQWVNAGQVIAYEGNTGNSFGCHLHFEVYSWGSTINPIDFMASKGIWV